jgi:CBS domain-containing protein
VSEAQLAEMRINSAVVCEAIFLSELLLIYMSSKIATGRFPITVSVDKIMSSQITVLENVSLAEAQLLMLKKIM